MAEHSSIEWTDATWNPITGCTKISPGCKNCYAEKFAERFRGVPGHPYEQGFDLKLWPERLDLPRTWKSPRMIFVNSMSDLFHEAVPDAFIESVVATMVATSRHTFQVLTKRSKRLAEWSQARAAGSRGPSLAWPQNVWVGVSIENENYLSRVDDLRRVPAATRFLSVEPLLGPLNLTPRHLRGIQWVIVGGESGPRARPMQPEWVRAVREVCEAADVAFFFKQWGAFNSRGRRVGKKVAGRKLDGRTWDGMPAPAGPF